MARVLYLTQVLPYPLDSGAKVRQYYMLRHLAAQHEVHLVTFVRPDDPPGATTHLSQICRAVHAIPIQRSTWRNARAGIRGAATGLPIVVVRDEIAEMSACLRSLMASQPFDLVHADQLSMAGYGLLAASTTGAAARRPATVLDEHNAIYHLTRRMAADERQWLRRLVAKREASAFARYERAMCRAYDAILTVTAEDRELLLALFDPTERARMATKFTMVPICVDPERTAPVARVSGGAPTILHLGTMFWPPNVNGVLWFAKEVLPLIWRDRPDARFVVVGKNPPAEIQALAADPRVEVTGYVADPQPRLAAADVFVVPLHAGGGMRVKILDAWLWGLPIVSTIVGAEGMSVQTGENILIADAPADFANAVTRLLVDPGLNARLRSGGRKWVEDHYSWQSVYGIVDDVYHGLLPNVAGVGV